MHEDIEGGQIVWSASTPLLPCEQGTIGCKSRGIFMVGAIASHQAGTTPPQWMTWPSRVTRPSWPSRGIRVTSVEPKLDWLPWTGSMAIAVWLVGPLGSITWLGSLKSHPGALPTSGRASGPNSHREHPRRNDGTRRLCDLGGGGGWNAVRRPERDALRRPERLATKEVTSDFPDTLRRPERLATKEVTSDFPNFQTRNCSRTAPHWAVRVTSVEPKLDWLPWTGSMVVAVWLVGPLGSITWLGSLKSHPGAPTNEWQGLLAQQPPTGLLASKWVLQFPWGTKPAGPVIATGVLTVARSGEERREASREGSDIKPTKRPRMSLDMFGEGYLSCQESKSGNIEKLLLRFVVEKRQRKILCKLFTSEHRKKSDDCLAGN